MTRRTLLHIALSLALAASTPLAVPMASPMRQVEILSPPPLYTVQAPACPFPVCTAVVEFQVFVGGPAMDLVQLVATSGTDELTRNVCRPPDPIEGIPGCPVPPATFPLPDDPPLGMTLPEGIWTVVARVHRGTDVEESAPVVIEVVPTDLPPVGPVSLSRFTPTTLAPRIHTRDFMLDPPPYDPNCMPMDCPDCTPLECPEGRPTCSDRVIPDLGTPTCPDRLVTIYGQNLHENPFLTVSIAPIPPLEPTLTVDSALPVGDWCTYETEIVDRGEVNGESYLTVKLPELPLVLPSTCAGTEALFGSILQKTWRFVIRDPWIRPEREHASWAIPTPRTYPWHDAPPFVMVEPQYPLIHGFGFANMETDPKFEGFLSVYRENAYHCVGLLGACATHVPNELYWILWWPLWNLIIRDTGGSCVGMSATSLLMANGELEPEDYDPEVHLPFGFEMAGDPATYSNGSICGLLCNPPTPSNLWARIRRNHGVQLSREMIVELLETVGSSIFDPDDLTTLRGVPETTLQRVAANPRGYVLSIMKPGGGHAVTPYRVEGDRIHLYDNNYPEDTRAYIDIVDGEYDYPLRRARNREPNHGKAIFAWPIGIWTHGVHLLGLTDFAALIDGDVIEFLYMITVGSADAVVTNDAGGRWGWEEDDSFTDSLLGAVSLPPIETGPGPNRAMGLALAMNQPEPSVQVHADGGRYLFYAGAGGHLLQLESSSAAAGDEDRIDLDTEGGHLRGMDFVPARDASAFVPRVGLEIGERESAVFEFVGLSVPGGGRVGFGADRLARAARFRNDSGVPSHHVVLLDHGSGLEATHGRMLFGPVEVPEGAEERIVLAEWPAVDRVTCEIDLDRDGTPDVVRVLPGRVLPAPISVARETDLSLDKTATPTRVEAGQPVHYELLVTNEGPESATGVTVFDSLSAHAEISEITTTHGYSTVDPGGLTFQLGDLLPGETAVLAYNVTTNTRGTLSNAAIVIAAELDPDLTNNSALVTTEVPVPLDILPGSDTNPIHVLRRGVVPVAVLGDADLDVQDIDPGTLTFGPAGAAPAHGAHLEDVNLDGYLDLLAHFNVRGAGIRLGDTAATLQGSFRDGRSFSGQDAVLTVP